MVDKILLKILLILMMEVELIGQVLLVLAGDIKKVYKKEILTIGEFGGEWNRLKTMKKRFPWKKL